MERAEDGRREGAGRLAERGDRGDDAWRASTLVEA